LRPLGMLHAALIVFSDLISKNRLLE